VTRASLPKKGERKPKGSNFPLMNLLLAIHLEELGLEDFTMEYQFHPERKWQMDIAIHSHKVALEVHGGIWSGGRHTRGQGFLDDREKMNTAQMMGWRTLEFSTHQVESLYAKSFIKEHLL
jgi:very-short-patch-repair endonuclease